MNTIECFAIPYPVPEISTFKEYQHHTTTTTTTTATLKIVTSSGVHVDQWLKKLTKTRQALT